MTKEELRKSLDFVNEERERLQYDIDNLTYQLAKKNDSWKELKRWIIDEVAESKFYDLYDKVDVLVYVLDKIKELENDL